MWSCRHGLGPNRVGLGRVPSRHHEVFASVCGGRAAMAKPSWLHGCRRLTESSHSTGLGIRFPDSALMPCAEIALAIIGRHPLRRRQRQRADIARMIAEAPSSSLPVRGADAIPYDELSDTEPEEKAAEAGFGI